MIDSIPKWGKGVVDFQGKNAYINMNPVMWTESDFDGRGTTASFDNLFQFLSGVQGDDNGLNYARFRYEKLRAKANSILPADFQEFSVIAKLLNVAISDYIIGNSIGTIASCGMIGEVITHFLFKVWNETLRDQPLTNANQERLFGYIFEKSIQKRRTEILFELGIIDSTEKSFFDRIRELRNDYIHINRNLENADKDAEEIFEIVNKMLDHVLQMKIENKKIWINKHIADYFISQKKE